MATHNQAVFGNLRFLVTCLLLSFALVAPFAVLEIVNQRVFQEGFPFLLFIFMSGHALLIALLLMPALVRLRSQRRISALRFGHWAGLALSVFLLIVYASVVVDQLPCFLGVPNCD